MSGLKEYSISCFGTDDTHFIDVIAKSPEQALLSSRVPGAWVECSLYHAEYAVRWWEGKKVGKQFYKRARP